MCTVLLPPGVNPLQTTRSSDFLIPCNVLNNNTILAATSDSAYSTPRNKRCLRFRTYSIEQHRKMGQLHTLIVSNNPTGGTKVMPHVLFSETVRTNCNQFYTHHGYILYKVDIIFPQRILHYQHTISVDA